MTNLRFKLDDTEVVVDFDRLMFAEAKAIEKVTGMTFREVAEAADRGSMAAIQAMAWVALKRGNHTLAYSDLDNTVIADVEMDLVDSAPEEEAEGDPVDPTGAGLAGLAEESQ